MPYAAVIFGSYFALGSAYESLRERSFDVNFLMVLAAAGAVAIGRPIDAAGLLFLFSLSSTLEALAMARTRSAIEGLVKLRPSKALLITPEGDKSVPVESLNTGDEVRVLAFEGIPADGVVLSGDSSVDQSAMTGESQPVSVAPGDPVLAGTQNLDGMIVMQVTAQPGDSTLEKIVDLVQDAQENKASGERISAWFGHRYTLFVVLAFLASLGIRYALHLPDALYSSLVLLVALSPCAVVISTPASTLSALAWAARNGILVRGGMFIEEMGRIDAMALDKTGTLTRGKPVLAEICVCAPVAVPGGVCKEDEACWSGKGDLSAEAREVLAAAAAAEQYSTHPIAIAIVEAARNHELNIREADEQQSVPGFGVRARIDADIIRVGQRRFFEGPGESLPADFVAHVEEIQRRGMTVVVLEYRTKFAALGLRDAPRDEAAQVIDELRGEGIGKIIMLTGDTQQTAEAIAQELPVDEVHAALMPHDKEALIDKMSKAGRVAMVGDGINDAPSLARANVGIAMGGLGSDIALNAADVVLMHDNLRRLPDLVRLGKRTNGVIGANLTFATGVIVALTLASFFLHLPLWLAVIGHEGSTVVVILNGLRLLGGPRRTVQAA